MIPTEDVGAVIDRLPESGTGMLRGYDPSDRRPSVSALTYRRNAPCDPGSRVL